MLQVFGPVDVSQLTPGERAILDLMERSPYVYRYPSFGHLAFELRLRANIVQAAKDLNASGASFAVFEDHYCNPAYWYRTPEGGFQLINAAMPAPAIRDIFAQGRLYGFECATAMVIVLYKAVLDTIGDAHFNRLFANLYLWDWHYDSDLRLITVSYKPESFPGDILYFKNPDFNRETPEWQGVNVVNLGGGLYYGHGIGIDIAERFIYFLNQNRRPGARQSAYLMRQVSTPDFFYLYQATSGGMRAERPYRKVVEQGGVVLQYG